MVAAPDRVELLRLFVLDAAPGGIEEVDRPDGTELAVYVTPERADALLAVLRDARCERVPEGWRDAWRAFHRPVVVGGVWIGPPWEPPPDDHPAVVIDPGLAFGTGAHPTTRLCVELLARQPRGALLDVGCGSGVLALAAARLGFRPIEAVDVDPVAVETTAANARINDVDLTVALADAAAGPLSAVEIAVANVLLQPVETILQRIDAQRVVTSGYLQGERPRHPGWHHMESVTLDGWAADVFTRRRDGEA